MKTKIIALHGGDMFASYEDFVKNLCEKEVDFERMRPKKSWRADLQERLGDNFDVFLPKMPMSDNADYKLWFIWFSKIMSELKGDVVFIGHSLGAMFLIKYFSENFIKTCNTKALLLVSPEYCGKERKKDCFTFNFDEDLNKLSNMFDKIMFFHSKDDKVVDYMHFEHFKELIPDAEFISFSDRGHFFESNFPEIVNVIKKI